jgi:hypothetical protein
LRFTATLFSRCIFRGAASLEKRAGDELALGGKVMCCPYSTDAGMREPGITVEAGMSD